MLRCSGNTTLTPDMATERHLSNAPIREAVLLATNTMDEGINATPAIAGDEMYLRTDGHLYCIAQGEN